MLDRVWMPSRTRLLALALCLGLIASLQAVTGVVAEDGAAPVEGLDQAYHGVRVGPDFDGPLETTPVDYDGEPIRVQAVDIGREAAEPTIGVTQNGTAFMSAGAFDAFGTSVLARTEVFRSRDGGLSWEDVTPKVPVGIEDDGQTTLPPTTLDPYVYVDEDTGRVFNPELYVGCSFMNISDDEGETWIPNPIACGNYVNDHQTIWAGPPPANLVTVGYPNVVYYCFNRVIDANCGRSLDGGLTFTPTPTPAFFGYDPAAGGLCGGLHGHIKVDDEGRLFLPKGHCNRPWIGISEDGGNSWERVQISNIGSGFPHTAVDVDDEGNLYYTWFDNDQLPYLATSTDHGRTWSDPIMIGPPGLTQSNFPVLAAGAEGRVVIMFPGTMGDPSDSSRPWNSYHVVSENALDDNPLFISTTANAIDEPIHRGNCRGRCAGMFDFLDVIVSPVDGMFWSSITDTCNDRCEERGSAANDMRGIAVRQLSGPALRPSD